MSKNLPKGEFYLFNWDEAERNTGNRRRLEWLKLNFDKPITEEEYCNVAIILKSFDTRPVKKRHRKGRGWIKIDRYLPSTLRNRYRRLKRDYGFFPDKK